MHKVVDPLFESKSTYDIFAGITERLGYGQAYTEWYCENWVWRLSAPSNLDRTDWMAGKAMRATAGLRFATSTRPAADSPVSTFVLPGPLPLALP
jgi:anaerobic selenocysteine-containing dehydrogenase